MVIIYVLVAAVIGAAISYFVCHQKGTQQSTNDQHFSQIDEEKLKSQINKSYESKIQEYEKSAERLKAKYESLLAESKQQIAALDEQLKKSVASSAPNEVKGQISDLDKLKTKIKKLEDEIEEYEDDIDDYKKKLKKKTDENSTLQDQLISFERSNKHLKEETEQLKEGLREKENELDVRKKSLEFVQEVLTARLSDDKDVKDLYKDIDRLVDFVKNNLKECLKLIIEFSKEEEKETFEIGINKWALRKKKRWVANKTAIAFVGEFSAGKTSIVNRILSQDNPNVLKLPVSTKATTAIPTYISGGESTYYNFVTPDNLLKNISEETFRNVSKEVLDQIKGVSSMIQYFVMTYKNPTLNNLSILDTPGFNSNDKEDAERTIDVINECDALFWVFDVNAGTVNRSSIELIKEHLQKPLYVVINKVDTKAASEVDKVEALIKRTLQEAGIKVQQFLRFSAKAPLKDIMNPIRSVQHDRSEDQYMDDLLCKVEKCDKTLQSQVRESNKRQLESFKRCNRLVDEYVRAISLLRDSCERAAAIPHFEKHLFGSNRYEMKEDEYNELDNCLSDIADDRVQQLCKLYDSQMEAQQKAHNDYTNYCDEKSDARELFNCNRELKKLYNQVNGR